MVVPERRNVEAIIEERLSYAIAFNDQLLTIDDSRFVFIDEVGYSVSLCTRRGRSLRGTSVHILVGAIRSRNMSVIATMSKYGMLSTKSMRDLSMEKILRIFLEISMLIVSKRIFRTPNLLWTTRAYIITQVLLN